MTPSLSADRPTDGRLPALGEIRLTRARFASRVIAIALLFPVVLLSTTATRADLIVSANQTQSGGTLVVTPTNTALVVNHRSNNPLLTLTSNAGTSGVGAVIVGSLTNDEGQLLVNGGSILTNTGTGTSLGSYGSRDVFTGYGYLGLNNRATGSATVTGTGSQWNNSQELHVGIAGDGTLNVQAGGVVSNTVGLIALHPTSTGSATVTGPGSQWNNSQELYVGGDANQARGTGTLHILNSGTVNVAMMTKLWSSGTLNLNGGALTTGSLNVAQGTFNFTAGTLSVSGATTTAGSLVVLTGGTFINNGSINGTVNVAHGGFVQGNGTFHTLSVNGTVSPGNSPGTVTDTITNWNTGGSYLWEINSTTGTAGATTGWDLWNTGALSITDPFSIDLASLDVNDDPGSLTGWDALANQQWLIATADNGAFNSLANLSLNPTGFTDFNTLDGGTFALQSAEGGDQLWLHFTAAAVNAVVPEPSTLMLVVMGGVAVGLAARRRQLRKTCG